MNQRRLAQLVSTAYRTLRHHGVLKLLTQTLRWLRGKRGYGNTLPPDCPNYSRYRRLLQQSDLATIVQEAAEETFPHFCVITFSNQRDIQTSYQSLLQQTWQNFHWLVIAETSIDIADPLCSVFPTVPHNLRGDYILVLEEGDKLAPHALSLMAQSIRSEQPDLLYSDYDSFKDRSYSEPFFKPDWSPEMLLSVNYVHPFVVFRKTLWQRLEVTSSIHDWILQASELKLKVRHIAQVLYHRHYDALNSTDPRAIRAALERRGLINIRIDVRADNLVHPTWDSPWPKIAIVIPDYNQPKLLAKCLESLFQVTDYPHFEVIIVNSGSTNPRTLALYEHYQSKYQNFTLVENSLPFNFGQACNLGAASSQAEVLLFLNNDTEIVEHSWLREMVQWLELPEIGVVGAKLLYPDGHIQHGGVILGMSGLADHVFARASENISTPYGTDFMIRNYMAVTGACLMIRRSIFEDIQGFDEGYQLVFSDVALCLAVYRKAWRIVYTPYAHLIHHEAATHRHRLPKQDLQRAALEFLPLLRDGDPFYNPNLTLRWRIPLLNSGPNDKALALLKENLLAHGIAEHLVDTLNPL